jgi:alpha-tubulin suppressor-like RCC1 family protein
MPHTGSHLAPPSSRGALGRARGRLVPMLALALVMPAWGCNDDPQAPSAITESTSPSLAAAATAPLSFLQLSTGDGQGCGVTGDSVGYCWGYNRDAELGDGTTTSPRLAPVPVQSGLHFRTVVAGAFHTCGLAVSGEAYCWGDNSFGQLGDGTTSLSTSPRVTPVAVQGGLRFRNVTVGRFYTCGVTTDDRAYCWGYNGSGQLGLGSYPDGARVPTAVVGGFQFRSVSAGSGHTCGITTADRAVCWGANNYGQLGDSTSVSLRLAPGRVAGGRYYKWLDAGQFHTCAVTTEGRAFCWGNGRAGQLGNGHTYLSFWPRRAGGGLFFRNITAGASHSCGVGTDGRAYCWGFNGYGQLGDGTTTQRTTPAVVNGGIAFIRLSGGEAFSCGLSTGARVYCWGGNWVGQLGDGTTTNRLLPGAVVGPS